MILVGKGVKFKCVDCNVFVPDDFGNHAYVLHMLDRVCN